MTQGQASEPPQGTPGRRALGAMESAVRRARAAAAGPSPAGPSPAGPLPAGPLPAGPPSAGAPPRVAQLPSDRSSSTERWLIGSVLVVAVLVLVGAAALGASLATGGSLAPAPLSPTAAPPVQSPPPATASHGGRGSAGGTGGNSAGSSSVPAPSTAGSVSPGGAPTIAALAPASGVAGQGIQIAGANFLSSSGQIVATFNGQVAPTSCPAPNTCTVTVPPLPGTSSAQVVITTSAGPSNAVTFRYG